MPLSAMLSLLLLSLLGCTEWGWGGGWGFEREQLLILHPFFDKHYSVMNMLDQYEIITSLANHITREFVHT